MTISFETNPLRKGLVRERTAEPCIIVIFGGTGDLAHRKLVPALFSLACQGQLARSFGIVGIARSDLSEEEYRKDLEKSVQKEISFAPESCAWDDFVSSVRYLAADFRDPSAYRKLSQLLAELELRLGTGGNRLFYLATPPEFFGDIARNLAMAGLMEEHPDGGWRRLIIEKPFGTDLQSARQLNRRLHEVLQEHQIYRIDHYLGKETVQNLLTFRFANSLFEPIWNHQYIDHIQITVAETVGIEGRGAYYDRAGALRDIIQNHGMQLLSQIGRASCRERV